MTVHYTSVTQRYGHELRVGDWLAPTWNNGAYAIYGLAIPEGRDSHSAERAVAINGYDGPSWGEVPNIRVDGLYDVVHPASVVRDDRAGYWDSPAEPDPNLVAEVAQILRHHERHIGGYPLDEYQVRAVLHRNETARLARIPLRQRILSRAGTRRRPLPTPLEVLIAMAEVRAAEMGPRPEQETVAT